jgi:hypothetical protein
MIGLPKQKQKQQTPASSFKISQCLSLGGSRWSLHW